jgi:hypothetical protein
MPMVFGEDADGVRRGATDARELEHRIGCFGDFPVVRQPELLVGKLANFEVVTTQIADDQQIARLLGQLRRLLV